MHSDEITGGVGVRFLEMDEEGYLIRTVRKTTVEVYDCLDDEVPSIYEMGIPAVAYGPNGVGAHAAKEWVDLESVNSAARVQLEVIKRFCA